jgi:hypothetical protein
MAARADPFILLFELGDTNRGAVDARTCRKCVSSVRHCAEEAEPMRSQVVLLSRRSTLAHDSHEASIGRGENHAMDADRSSSPRHEHHTPNSEEVSEQTKCFECGEMIQREGESCDDVAIGGRSRRPGLAVAEGIVLCHACCLHRGAQYDHDRSVWVMVPWFDDLVGHAAASS